MWDKVLPLILAFIAGALGSIIAPWVNWRIEKRRQQLAYRKELVASWRKMPEDFNSSVGYNPSHLLVYLERHKDFYSLRPHLDEVINNYRTVASDSDMPALLSYLVDEIGRIERGWKLH